MALGKFDVISGPGAPGSRSGSSRGSFSMFFHLLGCLGAQVMTKKPFSHLALRGLMGERARMGLKGLALRGLKGLALRGLKGRALRDLRGYN